MANAIVAPRVLAKETITTPCTSPNTAPAIRVSSAAPGSDVPVTRT